MKIVNFAVRRPVTMIILTAVIILMGFMTLSRLKVDLYPEMNLPIAIVMASYEGAGPEEVELQVTKPLEEALKTISNIEEIQSQSSSGSSMIILQFKWGTNMDNATMDMREKIGLIERVLPADVEKPMVMKIDPNMMPIIQLGINGENMSLDQLYNIAKEQIEPRLARIPEVSSVTITGGTEREIKVEVDPVKLENYGLSLSEINAVLASENFNMSAGTVEQGDKEYFIRSLQQFEDIEDIRNVAIFTSTGNMIRLRDVAQVTDGIKDITQLTRVNGETAIGIHCLKQSDANTVEACEAVKAELEKISQELNLRVNIIMDQSTFINQALDTTKRAIVEGSLLAILIIFLFLRNVRSTVIIFMAIPLSIITTFILMYFNNSTLNLITLGGLALGVGRMVDDSIVVFENIFRHRTLGKEPLQAAVDGTSEVGNAVIAATLTILAVFFPILFTEGIAGILFKPLAVTISFAIFCSLFVALTVVPLMSSRMLTDEAMLKTRVRFGFISNFMDRFSHWLESLGEKYKNLLAWSLGHRKKVVIGVVLMMVGSLVLMPFIGAEFLPKMDSGEISISIEADKGSHLENTDSIIAQAEDKLREIPEIETIFTSVGSSGNPMFSGTQTNTGSLYVKLVKKEERKKSVDTIAEEIRKQVEVIPGAKFNVGVMDMTSSGTSGGAINVQVRGDDLDVLKDLSYQISDIIRNVPGTREVEASLTDGDPEVQIKIDRLRAASYGLTPVRIASEIKNAMQGTVATLYKVEGEEINVRVSYAPSSAEDLDYLSNLSIKNNSGVIVKLNQVASFSLAQGPIQITRVDQVRRAEITGDLLNRDLSSVMNDIKTQVANLDLPSGYTVEYTGQNEDMMESFRSLALALVLAIILVYAVMAVQYESFFDPFVIMFSVPTSIIGVVLGLLLTGRSLSVPAFIGLIMLVGIVVSNAIVFIDYLKQLREGGMDRNEAILETGRVRLRPILMTALSTILAMLPMSLGIGEGSEAQAPLATVVIGGLLVSTLITLVLVPVVYTIFDDWGIKISQRLSHKRIENMNNLNFK